VVYKVVMLNHGLLHRWTKMTVRLFWKADIPGPPFGPSKTISLYIVGSKAIFCFIYPLLTAKCPKQTKVRLRFSVHLSRSPWLNVVVSNQEGWASSTTPVTVQHRGSPTKILWLGHGFFHGIPFQNKYYKMGFLAHERN